MRCALYTVLTLCSTSPTPGKLSPRMPLVSACPENLIDICKQKQKDT